jgi:hypothetical protein
MDLFSDDFRTVTAADEPLRRDGDSGRAPMPQVGDYSGQLHMVDEAWTETS